MKTLVAGFLAAVAATAQAMTPADIYAKLAPSVWRVQTYDEDGLPMSLGSAVVVAPDTLVTNCHVLARAYRVVVKHDKRTVDARLSLWDPARDVCQVQATDLAAPTVTTADDAGLRVGQPVYAIGNPRGLDLTMSDGLLSSIRRNDRDQIVLLQTSASISMGSSGGGLFDDQARLIGLTTLVVGGMKPGEAQNLNFAVPVEWVQQLPQRHARAAAAAASGGASEPDTTTANLARLMPPTTMAKVATTSTAVTDDAHLPFTNDKMREAYQHFLEHPSPRAFVVGENGTWYATWRDSAEMPPGSIADAAQRAMLRCQQRSTTRCLVYAIDDRVVYDASKR